MTIRQATPADLELARSWLADARLPVADLTPDHMNSFLVAVADERPVGMVGLEQYGDTGLLRSLVVDSSARGLGVGRQLVLALEELAASRTVDTLWLLTLDADQYFSGLGYAVVSRDDAPDAIRKTVEFAKLCPGDAVLMKRRL